MNSELLEKRAGILKLYGEEERLINEAERCRRTGISRTTWWRMQKTGDTPAASNVGTGKTRWLLSDILLWINGS
ncbi:hypothetical protein N474_12450 [Pseudoalteromonas luteoviolacea CPMOR-2]|uniref:helix-turn-helix transcriptional regulator n=1 Tax=Pseudoalteromonas luteoviolacea TaxID=43657 RepID=UPI0007B0A57D|nr:AlpA family phage regulatory protein [Pseudoalteromonas luteoviolacea]KZN56083.1 hypothetical protein N474_12450 [Pseudoalteromonas luteoviolacea CPMOR-2]